jgi:hypothetical protein
MSEIEHVIEIGSNHEPHPLNPERERYVQAWQHDEYRNVAPGESAAIKFLQCAQPQADADCIDFGAGTGRGAWLLAAMGKLRVTMLDFAENCLDEMVAGYVKTQPDRLNFIEQDLSLPIRVSAAYGFCTDVMEHIQPERVDVVLRNILSSAQHVYFQISTVPDHFGPKIFGEPLHLTVKPLEWWLARLEEIGAVIHHSEKSDIDCSIYCSAWRDAKDIVKIGHVNTRPEIVDAQVLANIAAGWNHIAPMQEQSRETVLLAGGPSLNDCIDDIRALREEGAVLVTVNGSYKWAIDHGLTPSAQIVLDAREFNARFVEPTLPLCQYLIASQCHPSVLANLPKERTHLWHCGISEECIKAVVDGTGSYYPIPGGSTVVLRALPLLRMVGLSKIHIFGFDSCLMHDSHHGYEQTENDGQPSMPVTCGGRTFQCLPWMVAQATEFIDMIKFMADNIELAVYGDGLIAQIIATGAMPQPEGE